MESKEKSIKLSSSKKTWTKPSIKSELSIEKTLGTLNKNTADMGVKSYS
jgi:hypothetical protein